MDIGKALRGLMEKEGRSLRGTAKDLKVDRPNLYHSLAGGNPKWRKVEMILRYLGYEVKFVKSKKKGGDLKS
jgi:DNA-binding phage protein